jgi:hypothetical protein
MGLGADVVSMAPVGTVVNAAGNTNSFDFSGYMAGILCVNVATAGTTVTPTFSWSDDGTNWDAVPVAFLAAPAAITSVSRSFYPFLPTSLALPKRFRINWTAVTGSFTLSANAYMRR